MNPPAGIIDIEEIRIKPEYVCKGSGSVAVSQLISLVRKKVKDVRFVFCWPIVIDRDDKKMGNDFLKTQSNRVISFVQKNGFRRVGTTEFFAYAVAQDHPSRYLAVTADHPSPVQGGAQGGPAQKLHVHLALKEIRLYGSDAGVLKLIVDMYKEDPALVRQADQKGNTLLHLAAEYGRPKVIACLLSFTTPFPNRSNCDLWTANGLGYTPVKLLERAIQKKSDGHRRDGMIVQVNIDHKECLWRLRQGMGTLCQCNLGWLSPRLQKKLSGASAVASDEVVITCNDPVPGYFRHIDKIPRYCRPKVEDTVSYVDGLSTCFTAIYHLLDGGLAPKPEAIDSEVARMAAHGPFLHGTMDDYQLFKARAGNYIHIVMAVIEQAEQDEAGGDGWLEADDDFQKLPKCVHHDNDFQMAREELLGIGSSHSLQAENLFEAMYS